MSNNLPEGWQLKPLSDIADYHNGRAFKPEDWSRSGLPIIRIAQINNPLSVENYYGGDDIEEKHLIRDGDILFSWSATLAAIKWRHGSGVLNQHIFKVVERDGVDRDFLLYTIKHAIDALAEHSHGSTMKHIKKGVLKLHHVPLPPLSEQRRIAEILSSVDEAIQETQAVIEQTSKVKEGVLKRLLTKGIGHTCFKQSEIGEIPDDWRVGQIQELVDVIDPQPDHRTPPEVPEGIPYIGIGDFGKDGNIKFQNARLVSPEILSAQSESFTIHQGAFVFGKIGTIGRPAIVPTTRNYALSANLVLVTTNDELNAKYLFHVIQSHVVEAQIRKQTNTTSQPALGIKRIRKMSVPIPPRKEMREICSMLDFLKVSLTIQERLLSQQRTIKELLMSDLLTGRKRVLTDDLVAVE